MEKTLLLEPTAEESVQFQEQFARSLSEIDRLLALMAFDQEEIDRLKARSLSSLVEIRAVSERTDALLASLRAA